MKLTLPLNQGSLRGEGREDQGTYHLRYLSRLMRDSEKHFPGSRCEDLGMSVLHPQSGDLYILILTSRVDHCIGLFVPTGQSGHGET